MGFGPRRRRGLSSQNGYQDFRKAYFPSSWHDDEVYRVYLGLSSDRIIRTF